LRDSEAKQGLLVVFYVPTAGLLLLGRRDSSTELLSMIAVGTVEELGRRSTDVLDYEESDSGVRFVLSDRGQAWSLFKKVSFNEYMGLT
jgi:hypothetical protein